MNAGYHHLVCAAALMSLAVTASCKGTREDTGSAAASKSDFLKFVEKDDGKGVSRCVRDGLDVNKPFPPWGLPLSHAIQWRSERAVNALLEAGADPTLSVPTDTSQQTGVVQGAMPAPVVLCQLLFSASEMCGNDPASRRVQYKQYFTNYSDPQIDILSQPSTTDVYRRILASLTTAAERFKTNTTTPGKPPAR
jgi:hypothetical protein